MLSDRNKAPIYDWQMIGSMFDSRKLDWNEEGINKMQQLITPSYDVLSFHISYFPPFSSSFGLFKKKEKKWFEFWRKYDIAFKG